MKNAEWIIKTGHNFKQLRLIQHNELASRSYTVMLCDEPIAELNDKKEPLDVFRKWLDQEHVEPILDDAERAYLSAVIKPFRDRVKHICKVNYLGVSNSEYQYIFITLSDSSYNIDLPIFKRDSMYKGMHGGREYTIEELGL